MSDGLFLGLILVGGLLVWGFLDYWYWQAGRETLSQYVVKRSRKFFWFGPLLGYIIGSFVTWLFMHWWVCV